MIKKIKAFEESVCHFGAADLSPYLKIISRGCFICVPSFMLLTQIARFFQKVPFNSTTKLGDIQIVKNVLYIVLYKYIINKKGNNYDNIMK